MLICVVTVCTLLYNYAYTHGLPMPHEAFFIEIQNFCAWADKFWDIWGIFGRNIITNFGRVSPLSILSIIQPLFIQKN